MTKLQGILEGLVKEVHLCTLRNMTTGGSEKANKEADLLIAQAIQEIEGLVPSEEELIVVIGKILGIHKEQDLIKYQIWSDGVKQIAHTCREEMLRRVRK